MQKYLILFLSIFIPLNVCSFAFSPISSIGLDVSCLDADSSETNLFLGIRNGGFWRSQDGGSTWEAINQRIIESKTHFIHKTLDINVLDKNADTVIVKFNLFPSVNWQEAITIDGGDTWTPIYPLENESEYSSYSVSHFSIINKNNHNIIYHIDPETFSFSEDFGQTWEHHIYDDTRCQKFSFSQDPTTDSTLFITGYLINENQPGGVLISNDLGNTWIPQMTVSEDIPYTYLAVKNILKQNNTLLACTELYISENKNLVPLNHLLTSNNTGDSWFNSGNGLSTSFFPQKVVSSPKHDTTVLTYSYLINHIFKSDDSGMNFYPIDLYLDGTIQKTSNLKANKFNGNIYACFSGNGVLKSDDNAKTWERLQLPKNVGMDFYIEMYSDRIIGISPNEVVLKEYVFADNQWNLLHYPEIDNDTLKQFFSVYYYDDNSYRGLFYKGSYSLEYELLVSKESSDGVNWSTCSEPINPLPLTQRYKLSKHIGDNFIRLVTSQNIGNKVIFNVSLDTGSTWQNYSSDILKVSSRKIIQDEKRVIAIAKKQGVYISTDNCQTWNSLNFPDESDLSPRYGGMINPNNSDLYIYGNSRISRYSDGEWSQTGTTNNKDNFTLIPDVNPILVANDYMRHIYVSYNEGANWQEIPFTIPFHGQLGMIGSMNYDPWRNRLWVSTGLGLYYLNCEDLSDIDEPINLYPIGYESQSN